MRSCPFKICPLQATNALLSFIPGRACRWLHAPFIDISSILFSLSNPNQLHKNFLRGQACSFFRMFPHAHQGMERASMRNFHGRTVLPIPFLLDPPLHLTPERGPAALLPTTEPRLLQGSRLQEPACCDAGREFSLPHCLV